MSEMIRFYVCAALMCIGLLFEVSAVVGVFRFRYALNRIHAAAMGDTMGLFFFVIGLAVAVGVSLQSLKLLLLIVVFWCTSPISSHMIGRLEFETYEALDQEAKICRY